MSFLALIAVRNSDSRMGSSDWASSRVKVRSDISVDLFYLTRRRCPEDSRLHRQTEGSCGNRARWACTHSCRFRRKQLRITPLARMRRDLSLRLAKAAPLEMTPKIEDNATRRHALRPVITMCGHPKLLRLYESRSGVIPKARTFTGEPRDLEAIGAVGLYAVPQNLVKRRKSSSRF